MMKIALTGGIASGKSTVTNLLMASGVAVVDCDAIVHDNYQQGKPIYNAVVEAFGHTYLTDRGDVDRVQLGQLIFNHPPARDQLNAITHPIVGRLVDEALAAYEAQGYLFAVVDIPLLFETGSESKYDGVIVVYVDGQCQLKRLMARNGWTEAEALSRIQSQMSLEDKKMRANWLIDNSSDYKTLEAHVARVIEEIEKTALNKNKVVDSY